MAEAPEEPGADGTEATTAAGARAGSKGAEAMATEAVERGMVRLEEAARAVLRAREALAAWQAKGGKVWAAMRVARVAGWAVHR